MEIKLQTFRGIEFVRIADMPAPLRMIIETSGDHGASTVKVDNITLYGCIQLNDFEKFKEQLKVNQLLTNTSPVDLLSRNTEDQLSK